MMMIPFDVQKNASVCCDGYGYKTSVNNSVQHSPVLVSATGCNVVFMLKLRQIILFDVEYNAYVVTVRKQLYTPNTVRYIWPDTLVVKFQGELSRVILSRRLIIWGQLFKTLNYFLTAILLLNNS
jgi:hypothetical protein